MLAIGHACGDPVEGAWDEDGRKPSIWDKFTHAHRAFEAEPPGRRGPWDRDRVTMGHQGSTGDDACDYYHRYKEDLARISDYGFNTYRWSGAV
eukprot:Skav203156  [mRNA]  locus=scaffold626:507593:509037:+ [translate_table: standard]